MAARAALEAGDSSTAESAITEALLTLGNGMSVVTQQLYRDLAEAWTLNGMVKQPRDLVVAAQKMQAALVHASLPTIEERRGAVTALREDPTQRLLLAEALELLANSERMEAQDYRSARTHLEEALVIRDELVPDDQETVIRRAGLVPLLVLDGDMEEALRVGEQIRDLLRATRPGHASEMLRTLAQVHLRDGRLDAAALDAQEAVEAGAEADWPRSRAAALSVLGLIDQAKGDLDGAAKQFDEAESVFASIGEGSVPAAINLARIADVEALRGDAEGVSYLLDRSVDMLRRYAPDSAEYPQMLAKLAAHKAEHGQLSSAAAAYRIAVPLMTDARDRVGALLRLGNVEKEAMNLERARRVLTAALEDADELGDSMLVRDALMSLAGVSRWLGEMDSAERLYLELLDKAEDDVNRARTLSNLGGVYYSRTNYPAAIDKYREAIGIFTASSPRELPIVVLNLATALQAMGQLDEADQLYSSAWRELPGLGRMHVTVLSGRSEIAAAQGRLDDAIRFASDGVNLIEQLRAEAGEALFGEFEPQYMALQSLLEKRRAPGDDARSLQLAEMTRARSLDDELRRDRGGVGRQGEIRELRKRVAAAARRRMAARADPTTHTYLLEDLNRQEHELRGALEDILLQGRDGQISPLLTADEIRKALPSGTLLLEFAVVDRSMHVWAVTRERIELSVLSVDLPTLMQLVLNAVQPCYASEVVAEPDASAWGILGAAVLETVKDQVATATTVLISPAGPLHYVSFEPFLDGPVIVYTPSATVGLRPTPARSDARLYAREFVGFGNPAFDRSLPEFANLTDLPAAEWEVREIAEMFGDLGEAIVGTAAMEPEVRSWARRCRYLHLATHGIPDLDNPLRSGLVFATPGSGQSLLGEFDDVLHGYEMVDLGIEAELVVCASCYTGFGDLRAGQGMGSMGGALLQGGARWVLVTLWAVGDVITAAFTHALYRALQNGDAVPLAVAAARTEIRAYNEHPRWWGPFVLFGVAGVQR